MVPTMMLLIGLGIADPVPAVNTKALLKEQTECWDAMLKEELGGIKSILKLSTRPKETVSFLKDQLKPIAIEKEDVKKLLKALESEDEKTWKPAFEKMEYYDPRLAVSVKDAFGGMETDVGRQRIVAVLFGVKADEFAGKQFTMRENGEYVTFSTKNHGWNVYHKVGSFGKSKWYRVQQAIILLEHIGTLEAIDVLKTMTKGHPDASPTVAAKAALIRLKAE